MRVRRAPPPAARPSSPSDEEADEPEPAELIEVKIEPDAWLQQVQDTPRRRDVRDMLQLGEQLGSPLVMLPRGEYMVGRPRQTAKDAAAAGGAEDDFDSNSDTSMPPDHDQFMDSDQSGPTKAAEDEDLTSLSWLQDSNLLKAIPLSAPAVRPRVEQRLQREPSPGEERLSASPPGDPDSDPDHPTFNAKRYLDHNSYAYDPYLHASFKPPFSFSCLIFMAIEDSFHKALPVREIYGWITEHFPFYKEAADGWKNSVRHNLSLSKCFKRVERSPHRPWMNHGPKGSFWMVEPHYRNSLIHALQRSHSLYGWKQQAATGREPPVKLAKGPYSHSVKRRKVAVSGDGGPDPSLFPFLAARLMSGDKPKRSPVDPLALPEPNSASELLTPGLSVYNRLREGCLELTSEESESSDLDRVRLPRVMMISRSAYDDHTYAYCPRPERPPSSEDIDFGDGGGEQSDGAASDEPQKTSPEIRGSRWRGGESRPSSGRSGELTPEEVEGADLLLNLAGVSRSGSRSQSPQSAAAPAPTPDHPRRRRGRPRGSGRGRGRGRGSRS